MTDRIGSLVADLVAVRDELMARVERLGPERVTAPGLIGEWSGQQLIAHVGYWAGHATELIHAAELGSEPEGGLGRDEIEARNRTVADVAAQTNLATVRRREAGSFEALVNRLRAMDPALLDLPVRGPGTLERAVREDGPDHYREHAAHLAEALRDGG